MHSFLDLLRRIIGLSIAVLSMAATTAYGANVTKISATGRAAISDTKTQKARRHALEDALYMAALKAGADISSTAITSQGVLVRDVIKLDTEGRLVDFTITGEKNTGTHYEVKVNAFFAQKSNDYCPKPRYPSVTVLAPAPASKKSHGIPSLGGLAAGPGKGSGTFT